MATLGTGRPAPTASILTLLRMLSVGQKELGGSVGGFPPPNQSEVVIITSCHVDQISRYQPYSMLKQKQKKTVFDSCFLSHTRTVHKYKVPHL